MNGVVSHSVLAILWLAYFALHSLLAAIEFKTAVSHGWPGLFRRYRLFYNLSAIMLLVPVIGFMKWIDSASVWHWSGLWQWVANGLSIGAMGVFFWSTRFYDMSSFMGLANNDAVKSPRLVLSPLHRYVRHPWYFLALVIIWTRDMDSAFLLSASLMTGYFWWGSQLEERKLISEFGAVYVEYIKQVPGLIPWPGRYLTRAQCDALLDSQTHTLNQ